MDDASSFGLRRNLVGSAVTAACDSAVPQARIIKRSIKDLSAFAVRASDGREINLGRPL